MIRALSFVIACILTAALACVLYPIAALFWLLGKVGDVVAVISTWIFTHTNALIRYLWADLSSENKAGSKAGSIVESKADSQADPSGGANK